MAQMITTAGVRTTVLPLQENGFTIQELESLIGGPFEITELPGPLYAITFRNGREIGAERNKYAIAGHHVHMAHLEVEGKLNPNKPEPVPDFYGPVIFCASTELENPESPSV